MATVHWTVAFEFSSPFYWNTKTVYPQRDTPGTRCFHSIHTPTGCVWNGKGLSHGLKTCHWHVFLTPFRVPPFLLGKAVRQKGLVTLRSIRRKRRMATVHWTVAFEFSSPFYWNTKTVYPQRDTPGTRCFHSIHTPTGCVWNGKGLSHGLKTCHWHVFLTPFRVPPGESKTVYPRWDTPFLVRQKGLEPPTY